MNNDVAKSILNGKIELISFETVIVLTDGTQTKFNNREKALKYISALMEKYSSIYDVVLY